jgi:HAD superfamily hydrolase (TIGR01549 family)
MPNGLSLADFKAVLFDVDGTLIDSLPAIIKGLGDAFEHFNGFRPSDAEVQGTIGTPLRKQLTLYRDVPPTPEELAHMIEYTIERFEENKHLETEFIAALDTLRLVKRAGLKVALVTSKSDVELRLLLKRFEAGREADATVNATEVTHPKPDPESALLACEKLGVHPFEAVFIGDSIFDMRCARAAGIKAVAVAYGSGEKQALEREKPDLMFDTPEQLFEWANETLLLPSCRERK